MPRVARPPETAWTVAMAEAVTAAWRVKGLVTPVPSRMRVVSPAATARPT